MKCVHCLQTIPDGATVCFHCTRRQPLTAAQKNRLWWVFGGGAVILVAGAIIWMVIADAAQKNEAVDGAIRRAEYCGKIHNEFDRNSVENRVMERHKGGQSWEDAGAAVGEDICPLG